MSVGMFIVLLALELHAQQTRVVLPPQFQAPAQTSTGTGAITGTVVDAANDRPIAGAIVTDMEPSDLIDVSFMARLSPAALPVHLDDGEKKIQDLRLAR